MSIEQTVKTLLANATAGAAEDLRALERVRARVAWSREQAEALRAAHKRCDEAWERRIAQLDAEEMDEDEADALPEPPEQAELDAILDEMHAVRDRDLWPRKLYFAEV